MENSSIFPKNLNLKKRNRTVLFLYLICLLTCSPTVYGFSIFEVDAKDTLKVMTFNIQHGRGMDNNVDVERIAYVLIEAGIDIAALQEVDIDTERSGRIDILQELSDKTGLKYAVFGKNLEFEGGEYGNAILSRYPIQNKQNIHFKNISGEQRGVLAAVIKIREHQILFLNTHLDHTINNDSERVLYAEKIRDEILPFYEESSILLAGDLNDVPGSRMYQIINMRLKDSWINAGSGNGFTIPVTEPDRRIDYIFYSGDIKPEDAEVIQTEASDHLPLVVKFMFIND